MKDPCDNIGVHAATEKLLFNLVEEVVDTVATFDGRLTFTPILRDGTCVLTFSTLTGRVHLRINAQVDKENRVDIYVQWLEDDSSIEQRSVAYSGLFDKTAIRHHLGTSLADWYARAVRHQLGIDSK